MLGWGSRRQRQISYWLNITHRRVCFIDHSSGTFSLFRIYLHPRRRYAQRKYFMDGIGVSGLAGHLGARV